MDVVCGLSSPLEDGMRKIIIRNKEDSELYDADNKIKEGELDVCKDNKLLMLL